MATAITVSIFILISLLTTISSNTNSSSSNSSSVTESSVTTATGTAAYVPSSWCVARSDASDRALQRGLDYACGYGADCAPILWDGLCYLPNTLLAHASYAYNSYYQRMGRAPGSCYFSGTANIARTDPSYGSCVYQSKPRKTITSLEGSNDTSSLTTQTTTHTPPPVTTNHRSRGGDPSPRIGVGLPAAVVPTTVNSKAEPKFSFLTILIHVSIVLLITILYVFGH